MQEYVAFSKPPMINFYNKPENSKNFFTKSKIANYKFSKCASMPNKSTNATD